MTSNPPNAHKGIKLQKQKDTTARIRWWSPTQLLASRFTDSVQLIERGTLLPVTYGRI
jgi:hypothetical protein